MPPLLLLLLLLLTSVGDAQEAIRQVSIFHRHGARTNPEITHAGLEDVTQLTSHGETMMQNLGKLLRSTYGTFMDAYNSDAYILHSVAADNCIQSAHGVVRAFFDEDSHFLPIVKYSPVETDWMMGFNRNFPNVYSRPERFFAYQNNDALARVLLSEKEIELLASMFGNSCTQTPMRCALFAADFIQSAISEVGVSDEVKTLFEEKLLSMRYENNKHIYGFNASDSYAVTGSPAYSLSSKVLSDASSEKAKKIYHYSVPDVTISGLLNVFGNIQLDGVDSKWLPRFGAVLTITTYTNSNNNVSFSYAEPQQEFDSTFDYISGLSPINVRCQTAAGTVYTAPTCPLDDIWRYVNNTKPSVSNPFCYLRSEDKCDAMDVVPSTHCQYYRKYCPTEACGSKAELDPLQNYTCVSFPARQTMKHYALAAVLSSVIAICIGWIIGTLIAIFLRRTKVKEERQRLVSIPPETELIA